MPEGVRDFGEIRAEGIMVDTARLLREANFTEVEIGLQSIDPLAMELMDRNNNLKSYERAARAMLDQGIRVKVDLIDRVPAEWTEWSITEAPWSTTSWLQSHRQSQGVKLGRQTGYRQQQGQQQQSEDASR